MSITFENATSIEDLSACISELQARETTLDREIWQIANEQKLIDQQSQDIDELGYRLLELNKPLQNLSSTLSTTSLNAQRISSQYHKPQGLTLLELAEYKAQIHQLHECVQSRDWETAAQSLHACTQLPPDVITSSFANLTVPSTEIPDPPEVTLRYNREGLSSHFSKEFNKAVEAKDQPNISRFFKLFPLIGKYEQGIELYSRFISGIIAAKSRTLLLKKVDGPLFYASCASALFEHVAKIIEAHQDIISRFYGMQYLAQVIEKIQREVDRQGGIIIDTLIDERRIDRRVSEVKSYQFHGLADQYIPQLTRSPTLRKSEDDVVDVKEVDRIINEIGTLLGRWSLYCNFVTYTLTSTEDPLKVPTFLLKSMLSSKLSRLEGYYEILATWFFRRSIERAILLDRLDLDASPPISSVVDDVMYILHKSVQRTTSTGHIDLTIKLLSNIKRIMEMDYCGMLNRRLMDGGDRIKVFLAGLNCVDVSATYIDRVITANTEGTIPERTEKAVRGLTSLKERLDTILENGVTTLYAQIVKPGLRAIWNDIFTDISYVLTSYEDSEDLPGKRFAAKWDSLVVDPYKTKMTENSFQKLLRMCINQLVAPLEKKLWGFKANEIGAIVLEKDISSIISHATMYATYGMREKFSKIMQICMLLGMNAEETGQTETALSVEEDKLVSGIQKLSNSALLTPTAYMLDFLRKKKLHDSKRLSSCDLEGVAEYIASGKAKRIVLFLGAGISCNAGIPDFRSPETGLYNNLQELDLPYPEAVFELEFFKKRPEPFYVLAKALLPGKFKPTFTHWFVRLLSDKGYLLCCFTQNVDTLERLAGIPANKIVEAHGSFATSSCIECHIKMGYMRSKLADMDTTKLHEHIQRDEVPKCNKCGGLVKPDIVFFGEGLPSVFFERVMDIRMADLAIIIGTSLQVQPFASLVQRVQCPRVLLNLERVGDIGSHPDDVIVEGDCDVSIRKLAELLGWSNALEKLRVIKRARAREGLATSQPFMSPPLPPSPGDVRSADSLDVCAVCADALSTERFVWIGCSVCGQWYHSECVGVDDCGQVAQYHCPACEPHHGPSLLHRRSARAPPKVDYESLNQGTPVLGTRHVHVRHFDSRIYSQKQFARLHGSKLMSWARTSYAEPVVIPKEWKDSLDMTMPDSLTVSEVAYMVGEDAPVEVIDVSSQREDKNWNLSRWRDYYNTPVNKRDKIRNVISLEISHSPLANIITRPKFVRELDLVDQVWPDYLLKIGDYPRVKLYCLMSVQDSYTDFHVDFAGSSVFYHIINGAKTFLFIPPTELKKYSMWCNHPDQNKSFFADQVKDTYRIDLTAGDTMIIPTGWIHAVYTPVDSLVIGGNFLCPNLAGQIDVVKIERETNVPRKFRFPGFERVCWYTCIWILRKTNNRSTKFTGFDNYLDEYIYNFRRSDLEVLAYFLHELILVARGHNKGFTRAEIREIKASEAHCAEELVERLCFLLWGKKPAWWKGSGKRIWGVGWKLDLTVDDGNDLSASNEVLSEHKVSENMQHESTGAVTHSMLSSETPQNSDKVQSTSSLTALAEPSHSPEGNTPVHIIDSPTRLKRKLDEQLAEFDDRSLIFGNKRKAADLATSNDPEYHSASDIEESILTSSKCSLEQWHGPLLNFANGCSTGTFIKKQDSSSDLSELSDADFLSEKSLNEVEEISAEDLEAIRLAQGFPPRRQAVKKF